MIMLKSFMILAQQNERKGRKMSEKNMTLSEKIEELRKLEKAQKKYLKLLIEKKLIEASIAQNELNDSYVEIMKCENPQELEKITKKIKELKKRNQNFYNEIMETVKKNLNEITAFQMLVIELCLFFLEKKNNKPASSSKEKNYEEE